MKHQEIEKINRTFADFLEVKVSQGSHGRYSIIFPNKGVFQGEYKDLSFHSSYELLMEVVEKIEGYKGINVMIDGLGCEIYYFGLCITKAIYDSKRESIYNNCYTFLKWLEEQKEFIFLR